MAKTANGGARRRLPQIGDVWRSKQGVDYSITDCVQLANGTVKVMLLSHRTGARSWQMLDAFIKDHQVVGRAPGPQETTVVAPAETSDAAESDVSDEAFLQ